MIKVKTRTPTNVVPIKQEPVIAAPRQSDDKAVTTALESLAERSKDAMQLVMALAESQKLTNAKLVELADQKKQPIRLESAIERDYQGRMTKVVITPVYK